MEGTSLVLTIRLSCRAESGTDIENEEGTTFGIIQAAGANAFEMASRPNMDAIFGESDAIDFLRVSSLLFPKDEDSRSVSVYAQA